MGLCVHCCLENADLPCVHADWVELIAGMVKGLGSGPAAEFVKRFGADGLKEVKPYIVPYRTIQMGLPVQGPLYGIWNSIVMLGFHLRSQILPVASLVAI